MAILLNFKCIDCGEDKQQMFSGGTVNHSEIICQECVNKVLHKHLQSLKNKNRKPIDDNLIKLQNKINKIDIYWHNKYNEIKKQLSELESKITGITFSTSQLFLEDYLNKKENDENC